MQVTFCAALDGVACEPEICVCNGWLRAADALPKSRRRRKLAPGQVAFAPPRDRDAIIAALNAGSEGDEGPRPQAFADYPIYAWRTPGGVELALSTLCHQVRIALAVTDEPAAVATANDGWRRPLRVFSFGDDLISVPVTPKTAMPWSDYVAGREAMLDAIADRRQPLLARLAEIAALAAAVVAHGGMPPEVPTLTARNFLAFRGFLEARTAAVPVDRVAAFAAAAAPLFDRTTEMADPDALHAALAGDWREDLRARVLPVERDLGAAFEAALGARLFNIPVAGDHSLLRGHAELFESMAVGLRFLAALCAARDEAANPHLVVAALALGEHFVAHAGDKLAAFALPPPSHDRAPRMADLDMTLSAIC